MIDSTAKSTHPQAADTRRHLLIKRMQDLQTQGIGCSSCTGLCCTVAANSMQISAVEAGDILHYLEEAGQVTAALIARLSDTVTRYRLDRPAPGNGARAFLRRTYTCTFYNESSGWCQLPPTVKPYGCLAFNAKRPGNVAGEFCGSSQALLDEQAAANGIMNSPLDAALISNTSGEERLPIPLALLALLK